VSCVHLAEAGTAAPHTTEGCEDCLARGWTDWVRLRACLSCGHVGCCDSSPHRHATGHFRASGHPVIRSAEPGESWRWCYVDEQLDPGR
jgi:hypothetical protein